MDSLNSRQPFHPHASGRATGVLFVVGLHLLLVYGLLTGLQHDIVKVISTKVQLLVPAQAEPVPPPQPVKMDHRSARQAAPEPLPEYMPRSEVPTETAPTRVVDATPDAPASRDAGSLPATLPAQATAAPTDIRVACPHMVKPEMPRQAVLNGVSGVVRATAVIRAGAVRDIVNLTGPRVFHAAVKAAMLQYRCDAGADEVSATQEFNFQLAE